MFEERWRDYVSGDEKPMAALMIISIVEDLIRPNLQHRTSDDSYLNPVFAFVSTVRCHTCSV
jgi:hypothetical protein